MKNSQKNGLGSLPEKSPKLEMLAAEITELLKKYDVAGVVQLFDHGDPGFTKYTMNLAPSWSVVSVNEFGKMKINPPLVDPENPEAAQKRVKDTVNMLANIRLRLGQIMMSLAAADRSVRTYFNFQPKPGAPDIQMPPQN